MTGDRALAELEERVPASAPVPPSSPCRFVLGSVCRADQSVEAFWCNVTWAVTLARKIGRNPPLPLMGMIYPIAFPPLNFPQLYITSTPLECLEELAFCSCRSLVPILLSQYVHHLRYATDGMPHQARQGSFAARISTNADDGGSPAPQKTGVRCWRNAFKTLEARTINRKRSLNALSSVA